MGFLDKLFGRKAKAPSFRPTNRLEHLLAEAMIKPEKRPGFYRELFHFDLLAIGKVEHKSDGCKLVSLMTGGTDEDPVAFLYTSAEALSWYLSVSGRDTQPFVKMKAHDLLSLIRGQQGFLLNFGHDHSLHLPVSQVKSLFELPHTQEHVAKDETVSVGKPAELPDHLLTTLSAYKAGEPIVHELRFGMVQHSGGQPEMLYVLRCREGASENTKNRIKGDIYRITKDAYGRELAVNFLDLAETQDEGMWTQDDVLYVIE